jgi:hypothetical protein
VSGPSPSIVSVASGVGRRDVLREDADDPVLRLLARVTTGAEQARRARTDRATRRRAEVHVGIGAERLVEDLGLHRARDDVDRRGDAALTPVVAQAVAQTTRPSVAL